MFKEFKEKDLYYRIEFKEKDEDNEGYISIAQAKELLKPLNINQDEVKGIKGHEDKIDWYSIWDFISDNKYEELSKSGSVKSQQENNIRINELSAEKKEIYTLCNLLDTEGIELLIKDYDSNFNTADKNRNDLIKYAVENTVYKILFFYYLHREKQKEYDEDKIKSLPESPSKDRIKRERLE